MLITTTQWRLIKHGLLDVYRDFPDAESVPHYITNTAPVDADPELQERVRLFQDVPQLPWPQRDCVIIALMADRRSLIINTVFECNMAVDDHARYYNWYEVALTDAGNPRSRYFITVAAHFGRGMLVNALGLASGEYMDRQEAWVQNCVPRPFAGAWLAQVLTLEEFVRLDRRGSWKEVMFEPTVQAGAIFLSLFADLSVPCGYVLKATLREGFGPPAMRKRTQQKAFIHLISRNRMYRYAEEVHGPDQRLVRGHDRNGHFRYFWKRSGHDRLTLPRDPGQRTKLALIWRVEKTYVNPTWVGPRTFDDGTATHELLTDFDM